MKTELGAEYSELATRFGRQFHETCRHFQDMRALLHAVVGHLPADAAGLKLSRSVDTVHAELCEFDGLIDELRALNESAEPARKLDEAIAAAQLALQQLTALQAS